MSRKPLFLVPLLACTLLGAGCPGGGLGSSGKPTMTFTSSTESFQLGTVSVITLTATGTDDGAPWLDGSTPPTFNTTWGSFESQAENPGGADVQSDMNGTITGHTCVVQLFPDTSPPANGTFQVMAVYTDTAGNQVQATINITVTVAPVVSLTFSCETNNIGAFADLNSEMEIKCNAQAFDSNNNEVPGANIQFLAEAGSISYDSENMTWAYFPFVDGPGNAAGANGLPVDVMPLGAPYNEPSYVDTSSPMMPTRNPRDGLATLVAYVPADSNAVMTNGLAYAPYAGAPFVDVDDSGAYHPGDPFLDINKNQTYATSQSTILWKQIKILWTGNNQQTPPLPQYLPTWNGQMIGSSPPDFPYGGSATIVWTLIDQNLNVLAANDPSNDLVDWEADSPPDITPQSQSSPLNGNDAQRLGFDVDSNYNISTDTTWAIGAQVNVTVMNETACGGDTTTNPVSISGTINRSLYVDAQGEPQDVIDSEETLTVNASADAPSLQICGS